MTISGQPAHDLSGLALEPLLIVPGQIDSCRSCVRAGDTGGGIIVDAYIVGHWGALACGELIATGGMMATIAIYSMKGGVGKTSLAVNLAWVAAVRSKRRTLLWDLDGQAAASFILAHDRKAHDEARAVIEKDVPPDRMVVSSGVPLLDLLPGDASLRTLDRLFDEIDRKKRIRKLTEQLQHDYEHIILDCPPGLGPTSEQVIRGASLILSPMIPSALSMRAFEDVQDHLNHHHKGGPPMMPVFNMVDRRRLAHRAAIEASPDTPAIPMASAVEQMADRHAPIGAYLPRSPAAQAVNDLWVAIERRLAKKG
jgi:cellulose biosynthesis protein BcsQ